MVETITRPRMVIAPLDNVRAGERHRHLPSHLTILPWFELAIEDEDYFGQRMLDVIEEEHLGCVSGSVRDLFGPANDEPVTRLNGVLLGVHFHAIRILRELRIDVDPQFTAFNYVPHVSDKPHRVLSPDESLQLSSLAVIGRGHGREKVIEKVYEWSI